jgi:hypothetical protein
VADGTRVGAEKLDQHTQLPAGLLARPEEDSQYPEREQLVIRDRQEQQRASEEGGCLWVPKLLLVSRSSILPSGLVHSFVCLFVRYQENNIKGTSRVCGMLRWKLSWLNVASWQAGRRLGRRPGGQSPVSTCFCAYVLEVLKEDVTKDVTASEEQCLVEFRLPFPLL